MGRDFCINSNTERNILSTGSLHPSSIKSKKTMKFSSMGKFFLLISAVIVSLLFGSRLCNCSLTFSTAADLADQNYELKQVIISRPKSCIKCACFSFYSSDNGSECGNTIVGCMPPTLILLTYGKALLPPPPISGRLFPLVPLPLPLSVVCYLLLLCTSILTDLFLVATFNSSSLTSIYCYYYPSPSSYDELLHTSLIFLTNGSLRDGLNPNIKLIMRCLNGYPLGSIELILHTSNIIFSAFYLTLVFL